MKFSISREAMLPALQTASSATQKKTQLPVLSHVLLTVEDDQLTISGTDTQTQVTTCVRIDEQKIESGSLSVPAAKLVDLVRLSPDGSVLNFSLGEDRLVLSWGKSRYRLQQLPPEHFPAFSSEDQSFAVLKLPAEVFVEALTRVKFAMAKDDCRYYLNGICLEVNETSLITTASNGHILSRCQTEITASDETEIGSIGDGRIFPRTAVIEMVGMLNKLINNGPAAHVELMIGQRTAKITLGNVSLFTRFIDGRYPNASRVIPDDFSTTAKVSAADFKSAVDRSLVIGKEETDSVILDIKEEAIELSATNAEMESLTESFDCIEFAGTPIQLAFSGKYLKQVLEQVDNQEAHLSLTDRSLVIGDPNHEGWVSIVMPRRI